MVLNGRLHIFLSQSSNGPVLVKSTSQLVHQPARLEFQEQLMHSLQLLVPELFNALVQLGPQQGWVDG